MSFALDYEEVFGETARPPPSPLTLKTVLFAALQASVRSTLFYSPFDATNLLNFVGGMDDLVHISAISGMWRRGSQRESARRIPTPESSFSDSSTGSEIDDRFLEPRPIEIEMDYLERRRMEPLQELSETSSGNYDNDSQSYRPGGDIIPTSDEVHRDESGSS